MSAGRFPPLADQATGIIGLTAGQVLYGATSGAIGQETALAWSSTTKTLAVTGTVSKVSAAGSTWNSLSMPTSTLTLTGGVSVTTATGVNLAAFAAPTITSSSATTVTTGATVYIEGPPAAAGSVTLTTPLSLWVDNGIVQVDGTLKVGIPETPVVTAALLMVFGSGNTFAIVRQTTNDVELAMGCVSTGAAVNTQTAHPLLLGTNNTTRLTLPTLGGCVIGTAALATNATDGFLYIPTCAGTPNGTPASQTGTVAMIYDTTANKLMIYNAAWKGGTTPGAWT